MEYLMRLFTAEPRNKFDRQELCDTIALLVVEIAEKEEGLICSKPNQYLALSEITKLEDSSECTGFVVSIFNPTSWNSKRVKELRFNKTDSNWKIKTDDPRNLDKTLSELQMALLAH